MKEEVNELMNMAPIQLQTFSQVMQRCPEGQAEPAMPVLDSSAIDELRSLAGDDPSFLAEVIGLYVEESAVRLAQLQSAAASADLDGLAAHSHALRGSSANVGALQVVKACSDVEHLPPSASHDRCAAAVGQVRLALERVTPELEAEVLKEVPAA